MTMQETPGDYDDRASAGKDQDGPGAGRQDGDGHGGGGGDVILCRLLEFQGPLGPSF